MSTAPPQPDAREEFRKAALRELFLKVGLEYYVAGRAALSCGSFYIPGNLFHHGIEMLLKAQLLATIPIADLRHPRRFGHDLQPLWSEFKELFPAFNLSEFDRLIDGLNRFEDIRYPDGIENSATIGFSWGAEQTIPAFTTTPAAAQAYRLGVADVDAFLGRFIRLCHLNPKIYFGFATSTQEGRNALTKDNAACEDWSP
jgi:hypothetical protein